MFFFPYKYTEIYMNLCMNMVMDTDNFLGAAKNKDSMTTRRYHCRANVLLAGFYIFTLQFWLDLKKNYIVSFWITYNRNCSLENLWELGVMSICWKRNKQLVTRGASSTNMKKGRGLKSALHACNALWIS